jgi:hypothetical protein
VIDLVGGDVQRRSFAVLKSGGALISTVSDPDPTFAAARGVKATFFLVNVATERLQTIARMVETKSLVTAVGTVLPLSEARTAHEMLDGIRPKPRGKIVLHVADWLRAKLRGSPRVSEAVPVPVRAKSAAHVVVSPSTCRLWALPRSGGCCRRWPGALSWSGRETFKTRDSPTVTTDDGPPRRRSGCLTTKIGGSYISPIGFRDPIHHPADGCLT